MIPALNFSKAVSNTKTPSLSPTTTDEPAPPKTLNKGSASLKKEASMIQSSFSTETDAIVTAINESSIALAKTLLNCMQESTKGIVKLQEIAINNTSVIQDVSKTISQTSCKTNSEIRQGFDELNARFTSQEQFLFESTVSTTESSITTSLTCKHSVCPYWQTHSKGRELHQHSASTVNHACMVGQTKQYFPRKSSGQI